MNQQFLIQIVQYVDRNKDTLLNNTRTKMSPENQLCWRPPGIFTVNRIIPISIFLTVLSIGPALCQNQQSAEGIEPEIVDRETQHIQEFAETMADFIPTETFTFDLVVGEQMNFMLWPEPEVEKIRGVFYIDQEEESEQTGKGLFVGCEVNQFMNKTFVNERLGVFNLNLLSKPSSVKLIFKSDKRPMKVYLSYELKKAVKAAQVQEQNPSQNVPTQGEQTLNESEQKLREVSQKFERVRITVQGQEAALRMIVQRVNKHSRRLSRQLNFSTIRIVIETIIVVLSGLFGMWLLKKQLSNGYELLV